jgi:hypothetical protein
MLHSRRLFVSLVVGFHYLLNIGPAYCEDGFQPMFTDTDLTGWVRTNTPEETWRFEDGVLYCTGKPIGEIRTARMYQNFVMDLEWRHMKPGGNAGIFVWADDITSRGVPFHRGIEVQVLENAYGNNRSHTTHGDIFPIHGADMTPVNGRGGKRAFPTEFRSNPAPEWNHYRIECRDGEISLAVNGKVVTRGKNCIPRKGYICLESEGGVVEYRNVMIKELADTPIDPDHVAIADRGYESIYSGLNLEGWEANDKSQWSANDWILAFRGDHGRLQSNREYGDVSFVIDVKLQSAESNAVIHAGKRFQIDLREDSIQPLLQSNGKWNRLEMIVRDGDCVLEVNGEKVSDYQPATRSSSNVVIQTSGKVEFCNLYAQTR